MVLIKPTALLKITLSHMTLSTLSVSEAAVQPLAARAFYLDRQILLIVVLILPLLYQLVCLRPFAKTFQSIGAATKKYRYPYVSPIMIPRGLS